MTGEAADHTRDPVAALVREADFGAYAATLFATAASRPHLLALYAFDIEIARVRDLVREPMPGELRLQWWRDALENPDRADAAGHPVARALEAAIAHGKLPREALLDLVDARNDDLYDDPVATVGDLEGRLGATASRVLRLASLIVAGGRDPGGADVAGLGGVAQGVARLLRQLPRQAARGQVLLPVDLMSARGASRDDLIAGRSTPAIAAVAADLRTLARNRLAEARAAFATLDAQASAAILPLAFVEPELARLESSAGPLAPAAEPPPWRRLLRLLGMSRKRPPF